MKIQCSWAKVGMADSFLALNFGGGRIVVGVWRVGTMRTKRPWGRGSEPFPKGVLFRSGRDGMEPPSAGGRGLRGLLAGKGEVASELAEDPRAGQSGGEERACYVKACSTIQKTSLTR